MKKNFQINLSGTLFNIDEDAYELLKNYTDSLRRHYRYSREGEEVVDDIEARIAELLCEQKAQGSEVVTIEHVTAIIQRIGEVESIVGEEMPADEDKETSGAENETEAEPQAQPSYAQRMRQRKFYLDAENKMVAGVLAGCAAYFGGDVVWWRIGFVVLIVPGWLHISFLPSLFFPLLVMYLIVAVVSPKADTPEKKLRMKGQDVTPQNLADAVITEPASPSAPRTTSPLLGVFYTLLSIPAISAFIGMLTTWACMSVVRAFPFGEVLDAETNVIINAVFGGGSIFVFGLLTAFLGVFSFCSVHGALSSFGAIHKLSAKQHIFWIVLLIGLFISCVISGAGWIGGIVRSAVANTKVITGQENTFIEHEGKQFRKQDYKYFIHEGWTVVECDNVEDGRVTNDEEYYTGDSDQRFMDAANFGAPYKFTIERTHKLLPGTYRLTAFTRAENTGAFIYLSSKPIDSNEKKTISLASITPHGNKGGPLWEWAKGEKTAEKVLVPEAMQSDESLRADIVNANDSNGYGWGITEIKDFVVRDSATTVYYGMTNNPDYTGQSCLAKWCSATDFVIEQTK
ncbi:MAG: PspC domain-containing protein [Bacteroidaceae bacterium]|nr:PspC domain-containing protein [Bacteroidaceae bacterium]